MNLVPMNTTTTQTMSSREIADLTGKEHKHVMRDIRDMAEALEAGSSFGLSTYVDVTGRTRDCYLLPKRETLILVSGYSVFLRSRIIDRWQELEAQVVATPAIPTNFVEALRLAADEAERRAAAEAALKEAQPVIAVGTRVASKAFSAAALRRHSQVDVSRHFPPAPSVTLRIDRDGVPVTRKLCAR